MYHCCLLPPIKSRLLRLCLLFGCNAYLHPSTPILGTTRARSVNTYIGLVPFRPIRCVKNHPFLKKMDPRSTYRSAYYHGAEHLLGITMRKPKEETTFQYLYRDVTTEILLTYGKVPQYYRGTNTKNLVCVVSVNHAFRMWQWRTSRRHLRYQHNIYKFKRHLCGN